MVIPIKTKECVTGCSQQTTNYFIVEVQQNASGKWTVPDHSVWLFLSP